MHRRYGKGTKPYGPIVRATVITTLTPTNFTEVYHPSWVPSLSTAADADDATSLGDFNGYGSHHVSAHLLPTGRWLVFADGREECEVTMARAQCVLSAAA